jgi:membrane-bound ClpP family serine protease
MAKTLAIIFGIVFILVGALGLATSTPLLGIFITDSLHDMIHLVIGLALLIVGLKNGNSAGAMKVVGIIYLLLAIVGFIQIGNSGEGMLLGIAAINAADNWLHLVLGIVLFIAGKATRNDDAPQIV